MSNDERLGLLDQNNDTLSAESDHKFQKLIEALNRSQGQTRRHFDAIDRRLEGLELRADVIEEVLSRIMRGFKIRQDGPE